MTDTDSGAEADAPGQRLDDRAVHEAASLLYGLRRSGDTIDRLPAEIRPRTFLDGYRIQDRLIELDGRPVGLVKVGCTTVETQHIMNLDEPIGGCLPAENVHQSGATIPLEGFHHPPLVECEFAMRLAIDIEPDRRFETIEDVKAVNDALAPALELVDGRYRSQLGIDGPSVVADNSMATAVVVGPAVEFVPGFCPVEPGSVMVRLVAASADGGGEESIAEGLGANVLGDPWRSLHWALRHLANRHRSIAAGTWVITGSCSGAPAAPLDRRLTAHFDGMGAVTVSIAATETGAAGDGS